MKNNTIMQSPTVVPRAKLGTYISPILESRRRPRSTKHRNDNAKQRSSLHEPPSFHVDEIGDWRRMTPNSGNKFGRFAQSTNALECYNDEHPVTVPSKTMFNDNFILRKSAIELSRHLSRNDIVNNNDNDHDDDDDVGSEMNANHDDRDDIVRDDNDDVFKFLKNGQNTNDSCCDNIELCAEIKNTDDRTKTPIDDEGVIDDDDDDDDDDDGNGDRGDGDGDDDDDDNNDAVENGTAHDHFSMEQRQIDSKSITQSIDEADSLISSMLLGSSFTASSAGASSPWRLRRGVGLFSSKYSTQTAVQASKSASLTYRNLTGGNAGHHTNSSLMLVPGAYSFDTNVHELDVGEQQHHHHHHHHSDRRRNSLNGNGAVNIQNNNTGKSLQNGKSPVNRKRMMMSAKSHSNLVYSSSSGCSTQSSSASSQASLSQHFSRLKTRSSLREATQNFREFVNDYEQGLIDAICSVEQQQRPSPESIVEDSIHCNGSDAYIRQCTPDYNNDCESGPSSTNSAVDPANAASQMPLELSKLNSSLRLQLENVRSLRDKYETGCRTSEALERLMKLTKQKRECDKEYRENERLLSEIESQLEAMIGTFRIRVEDLVGFARICPRDNYEIEFRHGKQRRVIRIRIGKSLERIFQNDIQEIDFQGALKPIIVCRLREVKSRWRKNVTLGETSISMSELLTAVACGRQILLDANASGTLKLRILCTWQPKELKLGGTTNIDKDKNSQKPYTVNDNFLLNSTQNSFSKIPRVFTKNNGFGTDLSKSMLALPTHKDSKKFNNNNKFENFDPMKRSKSTLSFEEHNDDDEDEDSLILTDEDDDDDDDEDVEIGNELCTSLVDQISVRDRVGQRIQRIVVQLKNLEDSLEDYRGQFAEFTMMSLAVQRLLDYFGEDNIDSMFDVTNDRVDEQMLDDVQNALAEFDFLDEQESTNSGTKKQSSQKLKANIVDDYLRRCKANSEETIERSLIELDGWNVVLSMHLENAREQLSKIGAWILKSREKEALARIRVNTFAFDNIYQQLRYPGKNNPMGKDVRVLELFSFAQRSLGVRWILTWSQLCQTLAEMIKEKLDLDQEWDDDSACYGSEWLCGKIVTYEQSKISLFDIRAFFELELWRNASTLGGRRSSTVTETLSLRKLFEIALDLDSLTRRTRKLSTQSLERILFEKFNFDTIWLPADVSLAIVEILYESHGQEKQSKPSASEVKKWNRLKEIRKICTNWLLWNIQEGRVEIKEHILSGLEASAPLTRRFSCYGIMYLLKLIKKFSQENAERFETGDVSSNAAAGNSMMSFVGKELDCLLYIAMEDADGRVREEARRALKCLGHLGEERLKQMERNRMGFLDNGSLLNGKRCGITKKANETATRGQGKASASSSSSLSSSSRCRVGGSVPDDLHRL